MIPADDTVFNQSVAGFGNLLFFLFGLVNSRGLPTATARVKRLATLGFGPFYCYFPTDRIRQQRVENSGVSQS